MHTLQRMLKHLALKVFVVAALVVGSAAITNGSLDYFDDEQWPEFVIEKLPLSSAFVEDLWIHALQIHVVAAALALPGCLLLMSRFVLRRFPRAHRWLGRLTGIVVVFALVPTGLLMALFAKGGFLGGLGFVVSGVIVGVCMVSGIMSARARRFIEHRRQVLHVLAQLSVAVTSRVLIFAFDAFAVDGARAYLIALWLPVIGSALIVEGLVPRQTTVFDLTRSLHAAFRRRLCLPAAQPRLVGERP